jgi:glyoxylase-like metal-dependent hydrolase (beta-lactamase superfamily II)
MAEPVMLVPNAGWDARVLVCRCGALVDTWVVVSRRYVVIVDTMDGPQSAAALLEIARPHLDGRQLLVLNTHSHWDHAWGNQAFDGPGALHPAPILATRACAELFGQARAQVKLAEMQAQEPVRFDEVRLTPPTLVFDGAGRIDGGDLTLELLPAPGHAPDQLVVWIPEIRTLLAADAAEAPFPFAQAPETLPALRATLAQMAALDPAVALYCHAPETAGPALLQANIGYFDALEERCRAALANGAPPPPPPAW